MESAGKRLKKVRLEKGIKLEDVHKKTRIHLNILNALEGDSITDLNPVYLKGFLKIYCQFLGVDPKDYIPDYKEPRGLDVSANIAQAEEAAEKKIEEAYKTPEKPSSGFQASTSGVFQPSPSLKLRDSAEPASNFKTVAAAIAVIFLVSLGLFNLGKVIFSRHHSQVKQQQKKLPIFILPKKEEAKADRQQRARAETAVEAKSEYTESIPHKDTISGIRLVIRTRENCWVFLKIDGKVVFQRVLEKGRFEGWKAKEKIELSLGNAGAVELEVNGKVFSNLGRRGQARKNIIITKDGLKIEG